MSTYGTLHNSMETQASEFGTTSLLLVTMTDCDFADPNRLRAKQLGDVLAKVFSQRVPVEFGSGTRLTGDLNMLAGKRIWHAPRFRAQDIGMQQSHALHFRRQNLDASDIDNLLRASNNFQEPAILLHQIAGIVPTFDVERRRSVEVAKHLVC